jgi:tryptophan synthase alpha chain
LKPQFFPYLLANYPSAEAFPDVLRLTAQYADAIEIGLPFTDPVADGPVIQQASYAVLKSGFSIGPFLEQLQKVSVRIPLAIMTYANLMQAFGRIQFCAACKEAGLSSLIVPDVPYEEAAPWRELANQYSLQWISFISLTTSAERLSRIARDSEGFLYLLALTGVTGSSIHTPEKILEKVRRIRGFTTTPVALGFGIKSASDTAPFRKQIDAFIIGSRIIEILQSPNPLTALQRFYEEFRIVAAER